MRESTTGFSSSPVLSTSSSSIHLYLGLPPTRSFTVNIIKLPSHPSPLLPLALTASGVTSGQVMSSECCPGPASKKASHSQETDKGSRF
ncbi:hypothetical protein E2C01_024208 [Portunus trituberculatus]|uniref:Uncharacterized protein n=1 Tax=Portunus trituberculatus TaxID=210409 RepID=A0A5B7ECJ1_PORTR|nr:hypothetical protein [Portunus trituberculatus]